MKFTLLILLCLSACTPANHEDKRADEFVLVEFASKLEEEQERFMEKARESNRER